MEDNKELLNITEDIALRGDAPWFGSAVDMEEYSRIVSECIRAVDSSTNVRQTVLETWLILDYFVRMILSNLWGLDDFNNEEQDFDLRSELLPGLEGCLRLLERILAIQRLLEENPRANTIKHPAKFLFFLRRNHPDFFERLLEMEEEYYQKYYPHLSTQKRQEAVQYATKPLDILAKRRYCVNKGCVEALSGFDEAWFKSARRLNKARNKAAHSHDPNHIVRAFGYSGANATEHIKEECLKLIDKLVGVVKTSGSQIAKEGDSG